MQLLRRQTCWLFTLGVLLFVSGCDKPPACRASEPAQAWPAANAGCLIRDADRVVAVQERLSGHWNLPGGTSSTESAACTAHRETWEETGLDVQVTELVQRYDNGFYLFRCEVTVPDRSVLAEAAIPFWWEIKRVDAVPMREALQLTWRYPNQVSVVLTQTRTSSEHAPTPLP